MVESGPQAHGPEGTGKGLEIICLSSKRLWNLSELRQHWALLGIRPDSGPPDNRTLLPSGWCIFGGWRVRHCTDQTMEPAGAVSF